MLFPAHIRPTGSGQEVQTAVEHSRNSAMYASRCLTSVRLEKSGYLAGLIHDCGKFKNEFAEYLNDVNATRGSVNHTFAGIRLLMERYHAQNTEVERFCAELLAFAAGGHHGLFDCVDENQTSGFLHRMTKSGIGYEESKRNFLEQCVLPEELDQLFAQAVEELSEVCNTLVGETMETYDDAELHFLIGLLARLLLSSVIEGDRRDTAEFMGGITYPEASSNLQTFWAPYLQRVEEKLQLFPAETPISRARQEISTRCRVCAENPGGIWRLNVPTGGGKTLSALRYALAHAEKWGKQRILFISPLLSILDQNAAVIREYIADDTVILEHHSNVFCTEEEGDLDQRELAVESWNAPIIITTLVQLLHTLFDGKTTSIRRMQGLCNSIIIIDEVQTVPPKMLTLFNLATDFLAKVCNATVILCSATQPCLEQTAHPVRGDIKDMVPYNPTLWKPFCRTTVIDVGGKTMEEIVNFARAQLAQVQSLLIVCNRKDEAAYFFAQLRKDAEYACHLSATMCMAHRRDTLAALTHALESGKKCLCVSTQVIEAGVDISFHRVIRLAAGMDSVIQAAGRCNRHGEYAQRVPVYVVSCLDERLNRLREIAAGKKATQGLLDEYRRTPDRFGDDLASYEAIHRYYQRLYAEMPIGYQDYAIEKPKTTLFDLLSRNTKFRDDNLLFAREFSLNQAFKLAGRRFRVFDSETRDIVVPYGDGVLLIEELMGQRNPDPKFLMEWEHKVRPYTVAIYEWQRRALGDAVIERKGVLILLPGFYEEETGLTHRQTKDEFLEV